MSRSEIPRALEPFQNKLYPFLYIVDDKILAKDIFKMFRGRYGLETGFGEEPTRLFHIDKTIPWIITEPNEGDFNYFKKTGIYDIYSDLNMASLQLPNPIIAINSYSTYGSQQKANTLVYRNLDYRDMIMVPYNQLSRDQRVVFIVNGAHADGDEDNHYYRYLKKNGYDPNQLILRPKSEPSLTFRYPFSQDEYVLDVTK